MHVWASQALEGPKEASHGTRELRCVEGRASSRARQEASSEYIHGEYKVRTPPKKPRIRKVKLFTRGEHKTVDNLKICCDLLAELPENERMANLGFMVSKFGYRTPYYWSR